MKNIKKTRKTITPIVDTNKLCQNIPLTDHRDSKENYPEVEKVVLPIEEILQNYYSMESKGGGGAKTLKTSFRMPHDILFQLRFFYFYFIFCGI